MEPTPAPTPVPTEPPPCVDFDVKLDSYPVGRPSVLKGNEWYPVCGLSQAENDFGADAACKKMGYAGGQLVNSKELVTESARACS